MFDILEADIVVFQETKIQRKDLRDDMVLVPGWDCYWSLPKHKKGESMEIKSESMVESSGLTTGQATLALSSTLAIQHAPQFEPKRASPALLPRRTLPLPFEIYQKISK